MRLAIILAILLAASSCEALELKHVTHNYSVPGSLKIKYTGIKKIVIDEARDFLEDEWRSDADTFFNGGQISLSQHRTSMRRLSFIKFQYGINGNWWTRAWFHSLPINKGGAPPLQRVTIGRTGDIINLGIGRVNENFRFKFKEYSANISNKWSFRFRPQITGNTTDIISRAIASFVFEYSSRGLRLARFSIEIGYKKRLREFVEFRIEMLNL